MAKTSKQTFDTIINTIKEVNKQWETTLYSFVQGKDIKVLPMTVGQQRRIITASYNSKAAAAFTTDIIDEILLQNTKSSASLTILDRPLMLFELRQHLRGSKMEVQHDDTPIIVNIPKHIKHCKDTLKLPDLPLEFIVTEGNISVTCALPTIEHDRRVNTLYFQKYNPASDNRDIMHELIGDAYVFEVAKYVKSIELHGESVDIINNTDIEQSITIIENLPYPLSMKITEKTKPFKELESALLTYKDSTGDIPIQIDSSMFIGE